MSSRENPENTYVVDPEHTAELVRLTAQDHLMNEAMGSLFPKSVDLTHVERVLDVACGPGGWALELAYTCSDMEVVGVDISERMIAYANAQAQVQQRSNLTFAVMDARKPLKFPDSVFDLVNARFMAAFLPGNEWPMVPKEFVRLTRPGGMIVLTEVNMFEPGSTNSSAQEELNVLCREAVRRTGLEVNVTELLKQFLLEAGCQDVQQKWHFLNFSSGTPAHEAVTSNLSYAYRLIQPLLLKMLPTTQERLDALCTQTLGEMQFADFQGQTRFLSVWGTCPETCPDM